MQVELLLMNALDFMKSDVRKFDVIFLDPPYRLDLLPQLMLLLPSHLEEDGLVYSEASEVWNLDKQWRVHRSAKAGAVRYQLLEFVQYG
jgi:16S rRNA G966 N2-methylase RsmD